GRIVGIKSLLDAVWITAAHVCVNAAQLDLVLLMNFKENILSDIFFDTLEVSTKAIPDGLLLVDLLAALVKFIYFHNSKVTSGSRMMLSSAEIETFFLDFLLLPVYLLACLVSDLSDTSTLEGFGVTADFLACDHLPLLFFRGIKPVEYLLKV
ncbi:hypothetical protein Tco_1169725, partial [Tanacetum coccineum]